jgi:hypothetical protein
MSNFALDNYIDVASRIVEFREKYPTGSLRQVDVQFLDFAGKFWVVYTAAAYRTPDDPKPGTGTAWEPVPGPTKFTRDSELQNAETAAWGRAIVASLAADTTRGIASAEEVRNRQTPTRDFVAEAATVKTLAELRKLFSEARAAGASQDTLAVIQARKDEFGK